MKIAEIHIYSHDLPVRNGPYTMANSEIWSLDTTLVKLVSNNGLVGWGETCPLGTTYAEAHAAGARAALAVIAPGLIGMEALPLTLHRQMDAMLCGQHGPGHRAFRSVGKTHRRECFVTTGWRGEKSNTIVLCNRYRHS